MARRIGVGFIGAGAVVETVHLPTLARMPADFEIVSAWDIDPATSTYMASLSGSRRAESLQDLLDDPAVEAVVVCTPARVHAEHVVGAMRAGKKAVLCEKPLAASIEDARMIEQVAADTGTPLLVGAMHRFDPAWTEIIDEVDRLRPHVTALRSSIVLPFNQRFEQWSSEMRARSPQGGERPDNMEQFLMRMGVMELGIHDIPLIRALLPEPQGLEIVAATLHKPFGYRLAGRSGNCSVDLAGLVHASWQPRWELEAVTADTVLKMEFTPSFVHAGSGTVRLSSAGVVREYGPFEENGYVAEWRALRDLVRGKPVNVPGAADFVADLRLALDIADQSCSLLRTGDGQ